MRNIAAAVFALAVHVNTLGPHPVITAAQCDAAGGIVIKGYDSDGLMSAYCNVDTRIIGKVIG